MLHEAAQEMNGGEESLRIPRLLFRYTKLEYLKPILEGKCLFFPKISSFNDPFDSNIFPDFKATKAERLKIYDTILKSSGRSRDERKRTLKQTKHNVNETFLEKVHARTIQETRAECGVLCLAESKSDILMWSHYGNRHAGACLAFDTGNAYFRETRQVTYQTDYPLIPFRWFSEKLTEALTGKGNVSRDAAHAALGQALFFTKSEHWRYEAEWRISKKFPRLLEEHENGMYFPFPSESLVGVVVGASAADATVATVQNWVNASSLRPQLFRARVSKTKFAVDISEIN